MTGLVVIIKSGPTHAIPSSGVMSILHPPHGSSSTVFFSCCCCCCYCFGGTFSLSVRVHSLSTDITSFTPQGTPTIPDQPIIHMGERIGTLSFRRLPHDPNHDDFVLLLLFRGGNKFHGDRISHPTLAPYSRQ